TRPSRARSSSTLARASASPNKASWRPCSPSADSGRNNARRSSRAPSPLPPMLSECGQRAYQGEAELEGQHPGVAGLGQVCESLESLLEGGYRLAERGAVPGPSAGLLAVGDSLVPYLTSQGMVCQAVHLLGQALGREGLQHLDKPAVEDAPPLLEQTAVGHLVSQG